MSEPPAADRPFANVLLARGCAAMVALIVFVVLFPSLTGLHGRRAPTDAWANGAGVIEVEGYCNESVQLSLEVIETQPRGRTVVLDATILSPTDRTREGGGTASVKGYVASAGVSRDLPRAFRLDYAIGQALLALLRKRLLWHPERYRLRVVSPTHTVACDPAERVLARDDDTLNFVVTVR